MCCIQNFHIDWLIDTEREDAVDPHSLGRLDGEDLIFTPEEISYITKKYVLLYKNRQSFLAEVQKQKHYSTAVKKEKLGKTYQFKPEISEKNRALAEQKLKKENPEKATMSLEDRLIMEKEELESKLERARQQR